MVLIISSTDDYSTNEVMDWLICYGISFIRITDEDRITITKIELNKDFEPVVYFQLHHKIYTTLQIKNIWYRRGWIIHDHSALNSLTNNINDFKPKLATHLGSELNVLTDFFVGQISSRSINKPSDIFQNKLEELTVARHHNLDVPSTLVTTSKADLRAFLKKHTNIITKNATPGVFVDDENYQINTTTKLITKDQLNKFPDHFFPMLFQEQIEKKFELRIFFIKDRLYASAIFSQQSEKTKIDFRNYNFDKPNRTPPYTLNEDDAFKLLQTMKALHLNSGSIDCIIDKKNKLYFLEVNPVGQYGQVSIPCNYYLDEKIALILSS